MAIVSGELEIYFTYELMPKATKQKDLIAKAYGVLKPLIDSDDHFKNWKELLMNAVKADRSLMDITWLQKHLNDYTAKNSFDYFIHKDLGGFLRRELDFFIKNEVLVIDDLSSAKMKSTLAIVKAIEQVGNKIITFLAQLEDFQKKLWLKKKFVVGCDYCITLDRIPESMYSEIIANDEQRKEWVRLFAIDEIKGDLTTEAYSEPLTIEFLKQNPFLVLDTKFFSLEFKHKLLATMENIDGQCNGLLINSENFQALNVLYNKYKEWVGSIYIDPPYNTGTDNTFAYKDNFQHSSWATMMNDRCRFAHDMMKQGAYIYISTDDGEYANLKNNLDGLFGEFNFLADIIWNSRKSVSNDALISIATNHTTVYAKDKNFVTVNKAKYRVKSEDALKGNYDNPDNDPNGPWKLDPMDAPNIRENLSYGITNPNTGEIFYPANGRHWRFEESTVLEYLSTGRILFGRDGKSRPAYKRYKSEALAKGEAVTSLWDDVRTTSDGTKMLLDMIGNLYSKSFIDSIKPKPVELIKKAVNISSDDSDVILDFFGGSGTTGHAIIDINRENYNSNRKFILCEVSNSIFPFEKIRIKKSIYSKDWFKGKPVSRQGISQCFKYIRLEQYEDTLNNLVPKQSMPAVDDDFQESYMLGYMLDTDTRGSLLNLKMFKHPFDVKIKTTKDNELVDTPVDMVETFNYLIGLNVETESWHHGGDICVVEGKTHIGNENTLVIWRDCEKIDNDALNEFFRKQDFNTLDMEYDVIYVNGDNTLPNVRRDEDHWKVVLTEDEFKARMFEED